MAVQGVSSRNDDGQNAAALNPDTTDSVDVLYEEMKRSEDAQSAQISALDGKANFSLGSATLLTTGVAALRTALESSNGTDPGGTLDLLLIEPSAATVTNWLVISSVVAYLVVLISSYKAYTLRGYSLVPQPQTLIDEYKGEEGPFTKARLAAARASAIAENAPTINSKVTWTRRALRSLFIEGVLLLAITLVQLAV
ncbi:MAG: hypothetical protein QOJ59_4223 [Thermomicrobiales bacterium]|jgi:hypothetical protein|nr:hypothetical protein [Thermomicrobiales bacterium]